MGVSATTSTRSSATATTVAKISKKWFRVRESYGVDVAAGEDAALILAITVAIDSLTTRD